MVADDDGIVHHDLQGAGSRRSFSDGSCRAGGRGHLTAVSSGDGPGALAAEGISIGSQRTGSSLMLSVRMNG